MTLLPQRSSVLLGIIHNFRRCVMANVRTKLIHQSIHHERTHIVDEIGRREKAFAETWVEENKPQRYFMFGPECSRLEMLMVKNDHLIPISQETATAVATIVQWLGTNIGRAFLDEALKKFGYHIVKIEQKPK